MGGNANFGIIVDFVVLSTIVLALRAIFPRAITVYVSIAVIGAYAIYSVAPRMLPAYLFFWVIIYLFQWSMHLAATRLNGWVSRILTTVVILATLSPMVIWKFWQGPFMDWFSRTFALLLWHTFPQVIAADAIASILAPIGLSFMIFRALDLLIKVRLGLLKPIAPLELLYYAFFAPVLAVGPIIEYEEVRLPRKLSRLPAPGDVAVGVFRISLGVSKVMILAALLSRGADAFWKGGQTGFVGAWAALWLFALYFYINFSGYSDMAIGASRIHGIKLKENFNNPFLKTNPQAFWAAWHMSLTRWVQRYVFIPLGGMRKNKQYFAAFMTIMAIAFWHGISYNMLIFGLYQGGMVVAHRWLLNRRLASHTQENKTLPVSAFKSFGIFTSQALAFPLLTIPLSDIPSFYAHLIPGM